LLLGILIDICAWQYPKNSREDIHTFSIEML
jgi:hypothetical protein